MAELCCNWQKEQEAHVLSSAVLEECPGRNKSINPKYQNGSQGTKDTWQDFDLGRVAG